MTMRRGDRVEVRRVWAYAGPMTEPHRAWFGGYRYVEMRNGSVVVLNGDGDERLWPREDVRRVS